jgi:signal transduction histidine kinase
MPAVRIGQERSQQRDEVFPGMALINAPENSPMPPEQPPPAPVPVTPSAQVLASIIAAQAEMTDAMPDSDAIMRLVVRHAMALSGAAGASIGIPDGDDMYLPVNEGFTSQWEGARFPVQSTLTGQCLLTGERVYLPDLDALPPDSSAVARSANIRTILAVPLRHEDHVVAVLIVASPQPNAFGEREILVVELLIKLAGSKLAHAQAFTELKAALADARKARAEAADFASMIAHELGSPIAAIQNACELLGMGARTPRQERARGLIATEARALRMLVGDLRAAAALEREAFSLHVRNVPADTMLTEAGDFARTIDSTHPVRVEADSHLDIAIDPGRIAQVLRNLVTNAAKYTPPGAPIEIRSRRDGDSLWIEVADRGPGIAPEDMEHIFSKFGRARHRADNRVPGLGLGLYLSRRIVEAHGGELTVMSTLGKGATFAFSVPVAA